MKRTIWTTLLALMIIVPLLLGAAALPAWADETPKKVNLPLEPIEPERFNKNNPYGHTKKDSPFLLVEKSELLLYRSYNQNATSDTENSLYRYDMLPHTNLDATNERYGPYSSGMAAAKLTSGMTSSTDDFAYVQAVAFDPFNSGRKDHVAFIGVKPYDYEKKSDGTNDMDKPLYGAYLWVINAESGEMARLNSDGDAGPVYLGSTRWIRESGLKQFQANSLFAITAGDYNGNNLDSIVVYMAGDNSGSASIGGGSNRGAMLTEYFVYKSRDNSFFYLSSAQARTSALLHTYYIGAQADMFGGAISTTDKVNNKDNTVFGHTRNKLSASLATGDFNGDGIDDLAVLSHINYLSADSVALNYIRAQLSVALGVENGGPILDNAHKRYVLAKQVDEDKDMYSLVGGSVAAGDLNNDGYDDIVVAGITSTSKPLKDYTYAVNDHFTINSNNHLYVQTFFGSYLGTPDPSADPKNDAAVHAVQPNGWTKTGIFEESNNNQVWPRTGLACVAFNGNAWGELVFINGTLYDLSDGAAGTVEPVITLDYFKSGDDGAGGTSGVPAAIIDQTFVSSVVAGNFDNNELGREQVAYTVGLKQKDQSDYYYIAGLAGGATYKDTYTNGKITKTGVSANEFWEKSSTKEVFAGYSHDYMITNKGDAPKQGLNCLLVAVDTDKDGILVKYRDAHYVYTDPEVAAVLQAAPYFSDVSEDPGSNTTTYSLTTSYEFSTSSIDDVSFSVGAHTTFAVAEAAKITMETGYSLNWSKAFERAQQEEYTVEFSSTAYDTVVVKRTPVGIYRFQMAKADGTFSNSPTDDDFMTLAIPLGPMYYQLSVDEYNNFADDYNAKLAQGMRANGKTEAQIAAVQLKKLNEKDDFLENNEGNPRAYLSSAFETLPQGLLISTSPQTLDRNSATTTVSWTTGNTNTKSSQISHGFYFNFAMSFGTEETAQGGFSLGLEYHDGTGKSKSRGSAVGKSSTVQGIDGPGLMAAGVPEAVVNAYDFQWELGTWQRDMGGSTDPVPADINPKDPEPKLDTIFVGYRLTSLKSPPLAVQNLQAVLTGQDTAKLSWSKPPFGTSYYGWPEAVKYNVYRIETSRTGSTYHKLTTTPITTTSFELTGLRSNSDFYYVVTSIDASGNESMWSDEAKLTTPPQPYQVFLKVDGVTYPTTGLQHAASLSALHLGNVDIDNGDKILEGSVINAEALAANPGYKITKMTISMKNEYDPLQTIELTSKDGGASIYTSFIISGVTTIEVTTDKRVAAQSTVTFPGKYFDANQQLTGTVTAVYGGQPFSAPGGKVLGPGPVTFTAAPEQGYALQYWKIYDNAAETTRSVPAVGQLTYDLYLTANAHRVEADFVLGTAVGKVITVNQPASGGKIVLSVDGEPLTLNQNKVTVPLNTLVTFTAQLDPGCEVGGWTNDGAGQTTGASFTMAIVKDTTVGLSVAIPASYAVTFGVDETSRYGTITPSPLIDSGAYVARGAAITFTAAADATYKVEKWVVTSGEDDPVTIPVEGQAASASHQVTINAPTSVQAHFIAIGRHNVTVTQPAAAAGKVVVTDITDPENPEVINDGTGSNVTSMLNKSKIEVEITVNAGYELAGYPALRPQGAATSFVRTYTVDVTELTTIAPVINKKPALIISAGDGGTVTASGNQYDQAVASFNSGDLIDYGSDVAVLIHPDKGYVATAPDSTWTAGAGDLADDYSYTLTNVTAETATIAPSFTRLATQAVTYGVVDTNPSGAGGLNGFITAAAERKGMASYNDADAGGLTGNGSKTVYQDGSITFTAAPDNSYRVYEWRINGVKVNNYTEDTLTFTYAELAAAAAEAEGQFAVTVQFVLNINAVNFEQDPANGALSAVSAGANLNPGGHVTGEVTFTAIPDDNYEIKHWLVNDQVLEVDGQTYQGQVYSFTPEQSVDVAVVMQGKELDVNFTVGAGGSVSGLPEAVVRYGDQIKLTATADAGYAFAGWYQTYRQISTEAELAFTVQTDVSYEARFRPGSYKLTFSVANGEGGRLTARANSQSVRTNTNLDAGTTVTFTAAPEDGYRLQGWSGNVTVSDSNPLQATLTMAAAAEDVTVTFEQIPIYTIALDDTDNGEITARVNGRDVTEAREGTVVTFTASPDAYYSLSTWTGSLAGHTDRIVEVAIADHLQVGAIFGGAVRYTVACYVDDVDQGTIYGQYGGGNSIGQGTETLLVGNSTIAFTAEPAAGYMVDYWTVNGVIVEAGRTQYGSATIEQEHPLSNTLTVEALTDDLNVRAYFTDYVGFEIPAGGTDIGYTISDVYRIPAETYYDAPEDEIRYGGDLVFTISPANVDEASLSKIIINEVDILSATESDDIQAVRNSDGSYTISLFQVSDGIELEIMAHKLVIDTLTEPPDVFLQEDKLELGLDNVEAIEGALAEEINSQQEQAYLNIALQQYVIDEETGDGQWVDVEPEDFPAGGVTVFIPYRDIHPEASSQDTFVVAHMLTHGERAGQIVIYEGDQITKHEDGISFLVTSMSPFGVGWTKYSDDPGGGDDPGDDGPDDDDPDDDDKPGGSSGRERYTLSFDSNGGSEIDDVRKSEGTVIKLSKYVPEREGYTFDGWYSNRALTRKVTLVELDDDVTVYAKWLEDAAQLSSGMSNFTLRFGYSGYTDVDENQWYGLYQTGAIRDATMLGIVDGYGDGRFGPNDPLKISEAIKMACVVHSTYYGDDYAFSQGNPWYQVYVDYAVTNGLISVYDFADYTAVCSRAQAAHIFANALPAAELTSISSLTPPDVGYGSLYYNDIISLYQAGVFMGNDADGTFGGDGNFTRAQSAAIITRLALPETRAAR